MSIESVNDNYETIELLIEVSLESKLLLNEDYILPILVNNNISISISNKNYELNLNTYFRSKLPITYRINRNPILNVTINDNILVIDTTSTINNYDVSLYAENSIGSNELFINVSQYIPPFINDIYETLELLIEFSLESKLLLDEDYIVPTLVNNNISITISNTTYELNLNTYFTSKLPITYRINNNPILNVTINDNILVIDTTSTINNYDLSLYAENSIGSNELFINVTQYLLPQFVINNISIELSNVNYELDLTTYFTSELPITYRINSNPNVNVTINNNVLVIDTTSAINNYDVSLYAENLLGSNEFFINVTQYFIPQFISSNISIELSNVNYELDLTTYFTSELPITYRINSNPNVNVTINNNVLVIDTTSPIDNYDVSLYAENAVGSNELFINVTQFFIPLFISDERLLVHYKFDDPANVGLDSSINNNLGTSSNLPTYDNGFVTFDGIDDYIQLQPLILTENISISLWVKLDTTQSQTWAKIFQFYKDYGNNYARVGITRNNNGNDYMASYATHLEGAATSEVYFNIGTFDLDTWYHLVWVIKNDGVWDIYKDNVKISNDNVLKAPVTSITYNVIRLGGHASTETPVSLIKGSIDDFRIYSKALSVTEVNAIYNKIESKVIVNNNISIELSNVDYALDLNTYYTSGLPITYRINSNPIQNISVNSNLLIIATSLLAVNNYNVSLYIDNLLGSNELFIDITPYIIINEKSVVLIDKAIDTVILLPSGQGVNLPIGSLLNNIEISVKSIQNPPPIQNAKKDILTISSDVLTFEPSGTIFLAPVTLVFAYNSLPSEGKRLGVFKYNSTKFDWEEKYGSIIDISKGSVSVDTFSFSSYGVFEADKFIVPQLINNSNINIELSNVNYQLDLNTYFENELPITYRINNNPSQNAYINSNILTIDTSSLVDNYDVSLYAENLAGSNELFINVTQYFIPKFVTNNLSTVDENLLVHYKFDDDIISSNNIKDSSTENNDLTLINSTTSQTTLDYSGFLNHESSLVVWYKFDDDLIKDSSSNNKNGILGNGTNYIPLKNTIDFKKGIGCLELTNVTSSDNSFFTLNTFQFTEYTTITFWFQWDLSKPSYDNNYQKIIYFTENGGSTNRVFITRDNTSNNIYFTLTSNGNRYDYKIDTLIENKIWYHISWSINNETWYIYINGVFIPNIITAYSIMSPFNINIEYAVNYIGRHASSVSDTFNGYVDDFRIYNKALTQQEVQQVMGYTLTKQIGRNLPYSFYWNGLINDNGDNAYLQGTSSTLMDKIINGFTVSFWKKYEDTIIDDNTFTLYQSDNTTKIIDINLSSDITFSIENNAYIITSSNIFDTEWHFWTFIYDGINLSIQKDTAILGIENVPSSLSYTGDVIINIGGNTQSDISPSYLEDFRIYNKALSVSEVNVLYNKTESNAVVTNNIIDEGLLVHYKFDVDPYTNEPTILSNYGKNSTIYNGSIFNKNIGTDMNYLSLTSGVSSGYLTSYYTDANNIIYKIHQFLYVNDIDGRESYSISLLNNIECDILIVGGGGSGGTRHGGGGGGGAFYYNTNVLFDSGNYTIEVGNGGIQANNHNPAEGVNGYDSAIINNTSNYTLYLMKGGGGGAQGLVSHYGHSGGSSGGNRGNTNDSITNPPVTNNIPSGAKGNYGGLGGTKNFSSGGGGGAGSIGYNGGNGYGGNGGDGIINLITGVENGYSCGGGGCVRDDGIMGGKGGKVIINGKNVFLGSAGTILAENALNAIPHTGSGGGGGSHIRGDSISNPNLNGIGGDGGSGIIIIRHKYYDPDENTQNKVLLQQNGHLYPYSFVWKGLSDFTYDDAYIAISDPSNLLTEFHTHSNLSVAFWFEHNNAYATKELAFSLVNNSNELVAFGFSNTNAFISLNNNTTHSVAIENIDNISKWKHWCFHLAYISIDEPNYTSFTTQIIQDGMYIHSNIPSNTQPYWNPTVNTQLKATIGAILDNSNVDVELSPNAIEDFRIYNKALTSDEMETLIDAVVTNNIIIELLNVNYELDLSTYFASELPITYRIDSNPVQSVFIISNKLIIDTSSIIHNYDVSLYAENAVGSNGLFINVTQYFIPQFVDNNLSIILSNVNYEFDLNTYFTSELPIEYRINSNPVQSVFITSNNLLIIDTTSSINKYNVSLYAENAVGSNEFVINVTQFLVPQIVNIDERLLMHYKFDDSTNVGLDSSIHNDDAIIFSGLPILDTNNKIYGESGLYMNAIDTSLKIPQITVNNIKGISISCWFKPLSGNANYDKVFMLSKYINLLNTDRIGFGLSTVANQYEVNYKYNTQAVQRSFVTLANDIWHNIVMIINSNTVRTFVNNVELAIINSVRTLDITYNYSSIGSWYYPNTLTTKAGIYYYKSYFDDFRIYNEALSINEVNAIYNDTQIVPVIIRSIELPNINIELTNVNYELNLNTYFTSELLITYRINDNPIGNASISNSLLLIDTSSTINNYDVSIYAENILGSNEFFINVTQYFIPQFVTNNINIELSNIDYELDLNTYFTSGLPITYGIDSNPIQNAFINSNVLVIKASLFALDNYNVNVTAENSMGSNPFIINVTPIVIVNETSVVLINKNAKTPILLPSGQGVNLPAGALSNNINISVKSLKNPPPIQNAKKDKLKKSSDILTFKPSGTTFLVPVNMVFKYTALPSVGKRLGVFKYNKDTFDWEEKYGSVIDINTGTVSVDTLSFSSYGVFEADEFVIPQLITTNSINIDLSNFAYELDLNAYFENELPITYRINANPLRNAFINSNILIVKESLLAVNNYDISLYAENLVGSNELFINVKPFVIIKEESIVLINKNVITPVLLASGQGVRLPIGSLSDNINISIKSLENPPPIQPDKKYTLKNSSDVLTFEPSGTTFLIPVTLIFAYTALASEGNRLGVFRFNKLTFEWEEKPDAILDITTGTISVKTSSFSSYGVFEVTTISNNIKTLNTVYSSYSNQAVISNDYDQINAFFDDPTFVSDFSVLGGIWSDDLIIRNIKAHNDSQINSVNLELNIGSSNDIINVSFSNCILGIDNVNVRAMFNEPSASIIIGTAATNSFITNTKAFNINASTQYDIITPLYIINSDINAVRHSFCVDVDGRIGMGVNNSTNIDAWLHIENDNTDDLFIITNTTTNTTPFIIKSDGKVGISTSEPKYSVDVYSDETSFGNHGDGIAMRDIFYLKQNNMNRISYGMGSMLYETVSSDICTTGFEVAWNAEKVTALTDSETFSIRISGKFHVTNLNGKTTFRRFEIAVNPKNDTHSIPGEIAILETYVFGHSDFTHVGLKVERSGTSSVKINILWQNTRDKARSYIDLFLYYPDVIGNLTFTSNNLINSIPL